MLLNGSAVNVVAVNAIDKIVVALQGLSQFSTASVSDLRLVANMIAASSINYSGSGDVSPAVVVQGSANYTVGTASINTLVAKLAGLSGTSVSSTAASRLGSRFTGSSSHTFNTLGVVTAAMVLAAESSRYSIGSSGNTPKLVSSLQALSRVLVNSEASNRLAIGTGSGVVSFSVVADSRAPISGVFYSGLASYALGSNAGNLLVSGLSGVSNIVIGADASVYTFISMDGNSGFDLRSESMVYVVTSLGASGVTFTVGSAGNNILTATLDGLSKLALATPTTSIKLVARLDGASGYTVTEDSAVVIRTLLQGLINYAYSSSGDNYLSTYVEGTSAAAVESKGRAHVVKFSLTVDDESAYVVGGLELVYNVVYIDNQFVVQYDDGTHVSSR